MKAVGLVVEYNPFHNGHLYHLKEAKAQTESDVAVAVMSGSFLQRGEPAIVSKWARTKMALMSGADIVVELPYAFAVQKAETFAKGAVSILNELGCRSLLFGSEHGNIQAFTTTAAYTMKHEETLNQEVKKQISMGLSYPAAMAKAFQTVAEGERMLDLSKPNNILGFHYVKTIMCERFRMEPKTVKRRSSDYHDSFLPQTSQIASATSIRKSLLEKGSLKDSRSFLPEASADELNEYARIFGLWHSPEDYFPFLKYSLYMMDTDELSQIYEVEEGLEHRVKKAIRKAGSFLEYMELLKTKRYTWTRLQRMNTHILTKTTKADIYRILGERRPPYLRLLGMTKKGQAYLADKKKSLSVPLITKIGSFSHPSLRLDIKAGQVYSAPLKEPEQTMLTEQEYSLSPIRYDEDSRTFLRK
ncbi:nucleotidyltransferase [Bacillus swezeyi]|uniref:tRNA(Met) cytidine acetate ligase n=1 Tax=Bacillus swezeyi TaxID=1925020 RepID=A0A5M8RWG5_9BACI|nr:nucleotidyltransferase [Bacillus swezeyi]KAA6452975.1 nucleotidyltransferase [Bacillus swezeyi]KAA6476405.1 nucleotidyltransferase [Bacillus swezeyi]TYS38347.1 nucleotidyltransferase [Bacillus swezeyi]